MDVLKGRILERVTIKGTLTDTAQIRGGLNVPNIVYPPTYQGDYTVTPTEETQTLQTKELYLNDDITINAIDSGYVGSDIPRRSALIVNGPNVTAQDGFYDEEIEAEIPNAENVKGGLIMREGDFNSWVVEDTGIVAFSGIGTAGWIEADNNGYISLDQYGEIPNAQVDYDIQGSLQLSTQGATTITPTTSEQTAVAKGKFTIGEVKVAPIPNNYGLVTWNGSVLTIS